MNSFDTFLLCHRSNKGKYTLSLHIFPNVLQRNYFLIISLLQIVVYAISESFGGIWPDKFFVVFFFFVTDKAVQLTPLSDMYLSFTVKRPLSGGGRASVVPPKTKCSVFLGVHERVNKRQAGSVTTLTASGRIARHAPFCKRCHRKQLVVAFPCLGRCPLAPVGGGWTSDRAVQSPPQRRYSAGSAGPSFQREKLEARTANKKAAAHRASGIISMSVCLTN